MSILAEIRERRLLPWLGAYAAAGFLALEGVDQAVGNELLHAVAYRITLILYLFGVPFAGILAWFHGKKGTQRPPPLELWLLSGVTVAALALSVVVWRDYSASERARIEAAESGLDPKRVAVLYFEDLSADEELRYLADGLTEALIDNLSQVRALDVVSRNGIEPYRGTSVARDSIARALAAGSLIEGSVEDRGGRVRVTVRLVEGASGADVERQSFELASDQLLFVRDSVAQNVSNFLRGRLGEEVRMRERRAGTASVDAWALVQRGERARKDAEALLDEDDVDAAAAAYQQADSLLARAEIVDPDWAEPAVMRARVAFRRSRLAYLLGDPQMAVAHIEQGLVEADRALELSSNHPDALEQRGTLNYFHWLLNLEDDPAVQEQLLADAKQDLESAVRADPTLASAHSMLSHLYYQTDDIVSVVLEARRAYEEDAYLSNADEIITRLFHGSYDLGQFSEAERWCGEGARRFPANYRFTECQLWMMTVPSASPDIDHAWRTLARLDSLAPSDIREYEHHLGQMIVGAAISRAGLADSATNVLVDARAEMDVDPDQELVGYEAAMRSIIGDTDEAIDLLKRYVAVNPHHSFEVGAALHWWWRPLQDQPGFQSVLGSGR